MSDAPQLDVSQVLELLSPAGQQQIVGLIREARERSGRDWLPAIREGFPTLAWAVDLAANKTADEALDEICDAYPAWPVRLVAGRQIIQLHARLKEEIDKPR